MWTVTCNTKPKEVTDFIENGEVKERTLSALDDPLDICYWIYRDDSNECYLHIQRPSDKALDRRYFLKTHKGRNELERGGTSIKTYQSGAGATTLLRKLVNEVDDSGACVWKATDQAAFKRAKEGDIKLAKSRRIDWDRAELEYDEGQSTLKGNIDERVKQDFIDRLSNCDAHSLDDYKDYVLSKGNPFLNLFARDGLERQLRRIETDYFRRLID